MVVVASGCSSGSKPNASPTTTAPATSVPASTSTSTTKPVPTSSTTTTTFPGEGPGLETLILTTAPSGFPRMPDSAAETGPTDLKKAALDDVLSSPAAARAVLVGAGFVRGYQRQWATSNGVGQNFIFLYQFATPEGATGYLQHWQAALAIQNTAATPVAFTPTGIPGAIGVHAGNVDGSSGAVLFTKGPYAVEAIVTGGPSLNQSGSTQALAQAQYAALP